MTRRRTNGDGAVYQTKDGRWRAAVDLGWKDDAAPAQVPVRIRSHIGGRLGHGRGWWSASLHATTVQTLVGNLVHHQNIMTHLQS